MRHQQRLDILVPQGPPGCGLRGAREDFELLPAQRGRLAAGLITDERTAAAVLSVG